MLIGIVFDREDSRQKKKKEKKKNWLAFIEFVIYTCVGEYLGIQV